MKVAVFGGTGFFGRYLVDALRRDGHDLSILVREGSEDRLNAHSSDRSDAKSGDIWRVTTGSIEQKEAIAATLADCDAAVYCIGILREKPRRGVTFEKLQYKGVVDTVDIALQCGVTRFLLMSANGAKVPGTDYQETKRRAEIHALDSTLLTTIFRPSVMFGDPRGAMEIATQFFQDMVRPPLPAPSFVTLRGSRLRPVRLSPVHVADVADGFAQVLENADPASKVYELGGPENLSWAEMIRRVARVTGKRKLLVPVPVALMSAAAKLLGWLPAFPVTVDQLKMLAEDNVAAPGPMEELLGRPLRAFSEANLAYLK